MAQIDQHGAGAATGSTAGSSRRRSRRGVAMPASTRTRRLVWLIAIAGGLGAAAAGPSPVGSPGFDQVLVITLAACAIWGASTAPWQVFVATSATTALVAGSWWGVMVCVAVAAVALARRFAPRVRLGRWALALQAGALVQVLARLGEQGPVWWGPLVAGVTLTVLAVAGVRRRRSQTRKIVWWSMAGTLAFVVLATGAMGLSGWLARGELVEAIDAAQAGAELFESGDATDAALEFADAAASLRQAESTLDGVWTLPARLVPVVAQHRDGAVDAVEAGSALVEQAAMLALATDVDGLMLRDGRIDLGAVEALQAPVEAMSARLSELVDTLESSQSPWLVPAIGERLDEAFEELSGYEATMAKVATAVAAAPDLLGAQGERVYFVAFTTPAEARGLGGFMGNFAEITVDRGAVSMTSFGRTSDLQNGGEAVRTLTAVPQEYIDVYSEFVYRDLTEFEIWPQAWSNITVSPHFPFDAMAVADLYPQSGGQRVDGVFVLDVFALAELMKLTGPVTVDELDITVTGDDAVDFLLFDQYLLEGDDDRVDMLEVLARTTFDRIMAGALPSPLALAEQMQPMVRRRSLVGWAAAENEQAVFQSLEVAGELPSPPADSDALHIGFYNASPSKVDTFLVPSAEYRVETVDGQLGATLTMKAYNTAPPEGLPDSLIGNELQMPDGTNRTYLTLHTVYPVESLLIDGRPVSWTSNTERGYVTNSFFIEIPPGQTITITATLAIEQADDDYRLVLTMPPLSQDFPVSVWYEGLPLGDGPVTESGVTELSLPER